MELVQVGILIMIANNQYNNNIISYDFVSFYFGLKYKFLTSHIKYYYNIISAINELNMIGRDMNYQL